MNGRQLGAIVVGTLAMMGLAFVIYGMLLASFFASNMAMEGVAKEMPSFPFLALGYAAWVTCLVIGFGRSGKPMSFGHGAKSGAMFGFLVALSWDMQLYATMNMSNLTGSLADVAVFTVMSAIVGGAAAAVLAGGQKAG